MNRKKNRKKCRKLIELFTSLSHTYYMNVIEVRLSESKWKRKKKEKKGECTVCTKYAQNRCIQWIGFNIIIILKNSKFHFPEIDSIKSEYILIRACVFVYEWMCELWMFIIIYSCALLAINTTCHVSTHSEHLWTNINEKKNKQKN